MSDRDALGSTPDAIADYLNHLAKERDVSPNTVRAYERDLREFVDYLGRYYSGGAWTWRRPTGRSPGNSAAGRHATAARAGR